MEFLCNAEELADEVGMCASPYAGWRSTRVVSGGEEICNSEKKPRLNDIISHAGRRFH